MVIIGQFVPIELKEPQELMDILGTHGYIGMRKAKFYTRDVGPYDDITHALLHIWPCTRGASLSRWLLVSPPSTA